MSSVMAAPVYTLYIRPAEGEVVRLRLSQDDNPYFPDEGERPCIEADARVMFVLRGFSLPRVTATIEVDGIGVIPCFTEPLNGDLFLYPEDERPPFTANIGTARITLLVSGSGLRLRLTSEPIEILLRPGLSANNLRGMAEYVRANTARLFGGDDSAILRLSGLGERLKILKDIAELYDRQYPYFRENARYQLRARRKVDAIERIRTLASGAAGWLMSHAHELERVRAGTGLRAKGKTWLPRHAPTVAAEQDRDIPENRAVAGFPLTLKRAVSDILALLDAEHSKPEHNGELIRSTDFLPSATPAEKAALKNAESVFMRLSSVYRDALCRDPVPLTALPPPSAHFLATAQYRLMYEAMKRWFDLPPLSIEEIRRELNALTGARLFEYYTLVRLLDGVSEAGFELNHSGRHLYSGATSLYEKTAGAPIDNTYVFTRDEETLTLWYQPLIGNRNSVGENGLMLYRATSLSFKAQGNEPVDTLRTGSVGYYTPDYVFALTKAGKTVWAVGDAKYSTAQKVRRSNVASLAFKYLVSLRTASADDIYAGVWLWCGYALPNENAEPIGSIFDSTEIGEDIPVPDLVLGKLTAVHPHTDPIGHLLGRMHQLLLT